MMSEGNPRRKYLEGRLHVLYNQANKALEGMGDVVGDTGI